MRTWPVRRVLAFGVLAALPACSDVPLLKLTLHYAGFEPACVQAQAADSSGASPHDPVPVHVPPQTREGELSVAIWGQSGWGNELLVSAEAHELTCMGPIVAQPSKLVPVQPGHTALETLELLASDADRDGYVATANGGTDCDDALATVHPGAPEICNSRDDNCVNGVDEGFSVERDLRRRRRLRPHPVRERRRSVLRAGVCVLPGRRPGRIRPDAGRHVHLQPARRVRARRGRL